MRKLIIGTALVLTTSLLTGCGSNGKPAPAGKSAHVQADAGGKPGADSGSGEVKHKVTLEVLGTGTSKVYYSLDTNKMVTVPLPWKKTSTIALTTDAEKRTGIGVNVVPGSVPASDGTLRPAACVITVDGKKVSDNKGGKSDKMCKYTVK
ncbi:hypothetical protein SAMN05428945_3340 [Streptomyces sp. 2224.1]|uniref:hypothetical protein n=1 Tax=unclassified Streptomyces TaxID=2593676 RepID=UPI000891CFC2|nr:MULTISPECIES: hypothetical protein [unclassified Streptomyces]PBC82103.1 hypothetical protein BX261_1985 [Streptomyces sp. 2321.6]SDR51457.1 hypothetical protein SAMN05216511_5226 [Streptomyces sp. KS_16]SEC43663.1 hypothetical protein SAMN05428940_1987 [Streptomyces sp. 2133.1]SEC59961.1 hypothetical protein SAMN05428945_3340 [Streptomyces sp. 2224.1]SEF01843.1 hypothetical protein SAMN05428954_5287 [Streptomyces sp. 2112.3]